MLKTLDWNALERKFSNPSDLPSLPAAAIQLTQLLNSGRATIKDLEKVIVGAPSLTANVLKAANNAAMGVANQPITTIHQAMLLLGQNAISNIATSMWVQATLNSQFAKTEIDSVRFNQHCTFVGFMGYHLFVSRMQREKFRTSWQPSELFTAGILHDVATGLLAILEPELFRDMKERALTHQVSLDQVFQRQFDHGLGPLGAMVLKTWGLPARMSESVEFLAEPASHPTESITFMCLRCADLLANANGFAIIPGLAPEPIPEEIQAEVGLSEEALPQVVLSISQQVRAYSAR